MPTAGNTALRNQSNSPRVWLKLFVLLTILAVMVILGVRDRPVAAQSDSPERVYLPLLSTMPNNGTDGPQGILVVDIDGPTDAQLTNLRSVAAKSSLEVEQEPNKLTLYYHNNDAHHAVLQLTCTGAGCDTNNNGKPTTLFVTDASITSETHGFRVTISINGQRRAVVEKVDQKLVTVVLYAATDENSVIKTIEFRCRQCDIDINIPTDLVDGEPTPTETPTPEETTTPGETPTPTETPVPNPEPASMTRWHAPAAHDGLNVHEHGDKPPAWADEFSVTHFGHPVIYGGDEGTPNENMMKHQAYKGFSFDPSDASGVELYVRYHAQSNPHGRSAPLHSYEVYAKDQSGNVSFWQGWGFYGYPEFRSQRMTRRHEVAGVDGFPGRDQFIIASPDEVDWENYLRCEQWYGHGGLWSWDLSITICNATTLFTYDEHETNIMDMNTWKPTGDKGSGRRLEVTHYGPSNPNVKGLNLPFDEWFCVQLQPNENRATGATPRWNVDLTPVAGPDSCADGWVPQYVADTFPKAGVYFRTGNTAERDFPASGVTLPN